MGGQSKRQLVQERLQEWGAPDALKANLAEQSQPPDVQPGNALTVRAFFAVATQWTFAGMAGQRTGLNYAAVEPRLRYMPGFNELTPEQQDWLWSGLQVMEYAALGCWKD